MINLLSEVLVAARGWSHPAWLENFYPDDLPEDWQLAYYSNEFRAIVVPAQTWKDLDVADVERWVEDTNSGFVFYLEVENPLTDWAHAAALFKMLGSQLGGILLRPTEVDSDLSLMATSIAAAGKLAPTSIIIPPGVEVSEEGERLLNLYHVEKCWDIGEGKPAWLQPIAGSALAVARLAGNRTFTAREWRETIETCLQYGDKSQASKDRRVLIMIDSEAPKLDDLRTAMMIADMLVVPGIR